MAIDIFSGKKSGRHARAVQRAEQAERDSKSIPNWRIEPEHLGSKTILSGLFVVTSFFGLFYAGMSVYSRTMENSLNYIQSKIPVGKVCLCRSITPEDRESYVRGEFKNLDLNQMIDDGLFLDNIFMRRVLGEEFYNLNKPKIKNSDGKCQEYEFRDFSKEGKVSLSDGDYSLTW